MKNLGGLIVSVFLFAFVAMLTPVMMDAINSASLTEPTASLIRAFPLLFLTVTAVLPILIMFKERKK